jgi:CarD family transcriptional regulator
MEGFAVGQQIVYPSHGVGVIEGITERSIGAARMSCYTVRLADNSLVMVPVANAGAVGLRPPLSAGQCETLLGRLAEDFNAPAQDWKDRFKEFSEKMKTGDPFAIADVLKQLTYLGQVKPLSFREQRMLEKAQYLVISEIAAVCEAPADDVARRVQETLAAVCERHRAETAQTLAASH